MRRILSETKRFVNPGVCTGRLPFASRLGDMLWKACLVVGLSAVLAAVMVWLWA